MQSINERFMNKFIELEGLCDELFECESGVTEYINRLESHPDYETEDDIFYNILLRCRNARNFLVHPKKRRKKPVPIFESDIEFLNKLYQDILNRRDPLSKLPKLHKATFYNDYGFVKSVIFKEGDRRINEPTVPQRDGYVGTWENYILGNSNIRIKADYTLIIHKVKFYVDGELIATVDFKEGDRHINKPAIPKKIGYVGKWKYTLLDNKDIIANAVFTSLTHKASFYAGDKLIATVNFKEGDRRIIEPAVPQIAGYDVKWGNYILGDKDIIVKAVATKKKEVGLSSTQKTISQNHLTPAEIERNNFWRCFDRYLEQQGNPFYVTHEKGGKNQAAGNINNPNPMAMQTICCQYRFQDRKIWVLVYINGREDIYNSLLKKREEIEEALGYEVDWIGQGLRTNSVQIIKKSFSIDKSYDEMVVEVFPYIKDFIRVFEPHLKSLI